MRSPVEQQVVRVLAAVIQRQERYLVCLRPRHKRHGGLWEFPGGKLESGETLRDAAHRELAEELGVEVVAVGDCLFSQLDPSSPFVIEFVRVEVLGEPRAIEHLELRWVTGTEMVDLQLAPSDRAFAESLRVGNTIYRTQ
jgi:8-oxo-dGTP diphosphatase